METSQKSRPFCPTKVLSDGSKNSDLDLAVAIFSKKICLEQFLEITNIISPGYRSAYTWMDSYYTMVKCMIDKNLDINMMKRKLVPSNCFLML